jgi:hypothetical protein
MKKIIPLLTLSLLASALTAVSAGAGQLPQDCRYSDGTQLLSDVNYYLDDMERQEAAYQAAPAGSFEEQRAAQARNADSSYAISYADVQSLDTAALVQLDGLNVTMESKYQAARAGSVMETTYLTIRNHSIQAFEQKGNENIQCLYDNVLTIDQYAAEFEARYQAARAGSNIEAVDLRLRNDTYARSEVVLSQSLNRMGMDELDPLQRQYEATYQAAPAGSQLEAHALRMRNALQNEILGRGPLPPRPTPPRPIPPRPRPPAPPSLCPPGTIWDPSIQRGISPNHPHR